MRRRAGGEQVRRGGVDPELAALQGAGEAEHEVRLEEAVEAARRAEAGRRERRRHEVVA